MAYSGNGVERISTKLLYTLSPVSTGMGDRLRACIPPRYVTAIQANSAWPSLYG